MRLRTHWLGLVPMVPMVLGVLGALFAQGVSAVTPKVAAGWNTFALKNDGTLVAAGNDAQGQLGLGRSKVFTTPLPALGLSQMRSVAAGSYHSAALKQDGTVWTWGYNTFGQLGDGTNVGSTQPSRVPNLSGVYSIAAGFAHTVALKQDGTVWAWGSNLAGQVGGILPVYASPAKVAGLSGVQMIAANSDGDHNLAIGPDFTVWAWGANATGQLGDGTSTDRSTPVKVKGLTGVAAIAAGYKHSVAVKSDGTVWAWGSNQYGQLGDGTTINRTTPVQVKGLSAVTASVVAGGAEHSMVITSGGAVWVWGANGTGQLGDGTTTDHLTPVQVTGFSNILAYAVGSYHNLIAKQDGSLWAWGTNFYGELGDGTTTSRTAPVPVPGMTGIAGVTASLGHSLALKQDGSVWAWGLNDYGQLGIGSAEIIDHSVPVPVPGLGGVSDVSAGPMHTVALKQDGTVWAWGSNLAGQVGDGTSTDRTTPVQTQGLTGATAVGAGGFFTMALKQGGSVWAWGANKFGQLGDGTTTDRKTPVQVKGLTGVITAIAAGYDYGLAVRQDGSVWAWGNNSLGQLGDGTTSNRSAPVQVQGLSGVKAVSGSVGGHSVALKNDGTVWAWGYNFFGQLGDGSETNRSTPAQVKGLSGVMAVSAGLGHSIAVKQDGTVWAWGSNVFGELGDGTTNSRSAPIQVQGLAGVAAVAASSTAHSVALKQDGTVWTWGHNGYGQLADGTYVAQRTPVLAVNETVTGFLDLDPGIPNNIPQDRIPPFLVATYKFGGATATSLSVDLKAPTGTGTFAAAAVAGSFAAAAYNVYVAAAVPSGASVLLFQLDSGNRWSTLVWPMAEFMRGVTLDNQTAVVKAQILQNADVSKLVGASVLVGYGTDPYEMVNNLRYRTIFTVPSQ